MNKPRLFASLLLSATVALTTSIQTLRASDHADGPTVAGDQAADLADCYMFKDPTDPTKIVLINTVRGFIVPGEAVNLALFDSTIKYRFQIENTGDEKADAFIDIKFSEKTSAAPQTATVSFSGKAFTGINIKKKYTGLTTVAGLGDNPPNGVDYFPATPQKLKDSASTEIPVELFAGETDDPFYFDIPGFARFRGKLTDADPNNDNTAAAELQRGRDTFAGYNVLTIALRLPISALKNTKKGTTNETLFGLSVAAQRGSERVVKGRKVASGAFKTVDREGLPAVNALLIPLELKNAYNAATSTDDKKLKFAEPIIASLTALGAQGTPTDDTTAIGLLAKLAVLNGDILRINTAEASVFPNGRGPADDVVKTLFTVIANFNTLDDSVAANDVPFADRFPYLGYPHQPRPNGTVDDSTRN